MPLQTLAAQRLPRAALPPAKSALRPSPSAFMRMVHSLPRPCAFCGVSLSMAPRNKHVCHIIALTTNERERCGVLAG
jgi:hypothetical protein